MPAAANMSPAAMWDHEYGRKNSTTTSGMARMRKPVRMLAMFSRERGGTAMSLLQGLVDQPWGKMPGGASFDPAQEPAWR